ncbi:MAG: Crp/Fnr family transcriptional regulator [Proteobacteria bacterium]|nr:Crp/Fnr family transcriptional regulator [Pseudomonadota bacterium]
MTAAANTLLAALTDDHRTRLLRRAARLDLSRGDLLHGPGDPVDYCYFPCGGAVAGYFIALEDRPAVEVATIGREGALGGIISREELPVFARSAVLASGTFVRLPLDELEAIRRNVPAVDRLFSRYADYFIAQLFQAIACNASHTIEQRLARWIGGLLDKTGDTTINLTQEQLGELIGVGRTYASRTLQRFRQDRIIDLRRGRLIVIDRIGLDSFACACNAALAAHFDGVPGHP